MRAREMKHLLAMVGELTANQRDLLLSSLAGGTSSGEWARVVQSKSSGGTPSCPKCQNSRTVLNGQANGLQRYKCRSCAATFNALTGPRWPGCATGSSGWCRHRRLRRA